ncbi:hypothetical protein D3C85_1483280 [compost metagenome]
MVHAGFALRSTQNRTLLARPGQGAFHQHVGTVTNPGNYTIFTRDRQLQRIQRLIHRTG